MRVKIDDKEYPVEVVRKNNKNTYIRVKNDKIMVTTNFLTPNIYINNLVNSNRDAIKKMLLREQKLKNKDDEFSLFGKHYDIEITNNIEKLRVLDNIIYAPSKDEFKSWLDDYIKYVFAKHLEECYNLFEEDIPRPTLRIRSMKTRWGVCNTKTYKITLNYELYKYDIACLDYVCIHELAHLIYANHSKLFWQVVCKYCPDYKIIRKRLRD